MANLLVKPDFDMPLTRSILSFRGSYSVYGHMTVMQFYDMNMSMIYRMKSQNDVSALVLRSTCIVAKIKVFVLFDRFVSCRVKW